MSTAAPSPLISVIMANYNGGAHIAPAVRSVLRQTLASLELIVSDDGSADDSLARARAAANGDPRLIIIEGGPKSGPAAARNRALRAARGEWIAIVDSDDFIHPERFETLLAVAQTDGADIVADDMLTFYENRARKPHAHLFGKLSHRTNWISASDYARANCLFGRGPSLGYLKPIFRRVGKDGKPLAYDESLTIAEDFDLVMRMLLAGARMRVAPALHYFYRKHSGSISHRLGARDIDAMLAAHDRLGAGLVLGSLVQSALDARRASILDAAAFTDLIEALKAKRMVKALVTMAQRPSALPLLRYPLLARLGPPAPSPANTNNAGEAPALQRIALLSRQRVVGPTNGSSSYILSIVAAIKDAGFAVDYLGASRKIFGRWPFLKMMPALHVFDRYEIRGGVRFGKYILASDPRVALSAARGVAAKILNKLKMPDFGWSAPAAYSIAAKAERADMLWLAQRANANIHAVLCDYAFLAPLAPYVLAPNAKIITVMHDLMSQRVSDDPFERVPEEVARLTPETEFRLLGLADVVAAIQSAEAVKVRAALPQVDTIIASHFVPAVAEAQPGLDDSLLFVGSNTPPNVVGLQWFFEQCWPLVRALRPNATLNVCGSVARSLDGAPEGVKLLGVVPELAPHYRDAGVVISPLRTGSGLKIKLIEALAAGKAVVGTTVTAQGVERIVADAMAVNDDAEIIARETARLLSDSAARAELGRSALTCVEAHFSRAACFGELIARLRDHANDTPLHRQFARR